MKFRIIVGKESSVEKPFVIQYKKFLFWRTFKHIIKSEKGLDVTIPYFSKKGAIEMLSILEETVNKKRWILNNIKITEDEFSIEIQDKEADVCWTSKLRTFYNALKGQGYSFSEKEAALFEELIRN